MEEKNNIDIAKEFLQSKGLKFEMRPGSKTSIMLRSKDRETLQKELEPELVELGFNWHPNAPGAGFGRFEILGDRSKGNAYINMKPIGGSAKAGADYEKKIEQEMKTLFPQLETDVAGSGHGSDLTLSDDNKSLSIEIKTKSGADFGEIPIGYDIGKGEWHTRKTKNFLKNEPLFQGVFDNFMKEKTLNMKPLDLDSGHPLVGRDEGRVGASLPTFEEPELDQVDVPPAKCPSRREAIGDALHRASASHRVRG